MLSALEIKFKQFFIFARPLRVFTGNMDEYNLVKYKLYNQKYSVGVRVKSRLSPKKIKFGLSRFQVTTYIAVFRDNSERVLVKSESVSFLWLSALNLTC